MGGKFTFGTPRKILEDYIQQLMMMFFADCRQNPPTVNCAMNADHYLKCKRYAVLSLTSAEDAMRTIKFSGILFLQHKLHIRCTPPKNNAEETLITDNWSDLLSDFYLKGDRASKWYDDMELLWDTYATAPISKFGQEFSEEVEYKGSAQQGEPIDPSLSTLFDNELVERERERKHRQLDYCIFDECSEEDDESSVDSKEINEVLLETIEGMDDDSIVLDEIRSSDTLQMVMGLVGSEELDNSTNLPTQTIPPLNKSIWSEDIAIINPGDRVTRERKEPQVNNGGTTSRVTSSQQTPSIGNTTLWFDIHQFEGWNSPYDQITKPIDKATNRKDKEVYTTEISKRTGKGSSNNKGHHQETKPRLATTTDSPSATSIMGDNMSIAEVTIDSEIASDHPNEQHPKKKKVHQSILQQQLGKLRMKSMIEVICHHQRVKKVLHVVSFWYLALLHHMMVARILGTTDYPREVLARSNQISQFFVPLNDGIFND